MSLPRSFGLHPWSSRLAFDALFWAGLAAVSSASSIVVLHRLDRVAYAAGTTALMAALVYALEGVHRASAGAGEWRRLWRTGGFALLASLHLAVEAALYHAWSIRLDAYLFARHLAGTAFVLALYFGLRSAMAESRRREERRAIETRLARAELAALRNAVHPHFLLNALNNLYSLIHLGDPRAGDYVLHLGDMLRYLLYEASRESVPLADELDTLRKIVELHRMKHRDADIRLELEQAPPGATIPPTILLHLLENCFKHGNIGQDPSAWILVRAGRTARGGLRFETGNSTRPGKPVGPEGIGLANARKLLEHFLPDRHTLELSAGQDAFHARLELLP